MSRYSDTFPMDANVRVADVMRARGMAFTGYVWDGAPGAVPVPGESAWQGYGAMLACQGGQAPEFVGVPYTAYGDYGGSSIDRANYNEFLELYPDAFITLSSGYNGNALILPMDAIISGDLANIINGLDDYPLVSDESHSTLEMETEMEDWESWGRHDFSRAINVLHGFDAIIDNLEDSDWDMLFNLARNADDNYGEYHMESAVSGYWGSWDSMVEFVANLFTIGPWIGEDSE